MNDNGVVLPLVAGGLVVLLATGQISRFKTWLQAWVNPATGLGDPNDPNAGQQNKSQATTDANGNKTLPNPADPTNLGGRGKLPSITPTN